MKTEGLIKFFEAQGERQVKIVCHDLNPEDFSLNQKVKVTIDT